jgi:hypothetical protein
MRTLLLTLGVALPLIPLAGEPAAEVKLIAVQKIWDQAPHNAFTDLIRFKDQWFCTFREGEGHAKGAGAVRILTSNDGSTWHSAAVLTEKDVDLRDPKLSVTPHGELMLVGGAAVPATRNPLTDHYSFVSFSADGRSWSKPKRVREGWHWLWRVTWHKGTAYGVAYTWDPQQMPKSYQASLLKSLDGTTWEKVVDFDVRNATEATLAFGADDRMYCLQRCDGSPNNAKFGASRAPYTEWTWKDLGEYLGGPNFIRGRDGMWWAAGRLKRAKGYETALCRLGRLDTEPAQLEHALTFPSAGDNSYPGLVFHNGELWMSYYSTHEKKTSIYLARVQVPGTR